MVKLVDTRDLKSRARKGVPVRFRLRAPLESRTCPATSRFAMLAVFRKNDVVPQNLDIDKIISISPARLWRTSNSRASLAGTVFALPGADHSNCPRSH